VTHPRLDIRAAVALKKAAVATSPSTRSCVSSARGAPATVSGRIRCSRPHVPVDGQPKPATEKQPRRVGHRHEHTESGNCQHTHQRRTTVLGVIRSRAATQGLLAATPVGVRCARRGERVHVRRDSARTWRAAVPHPPRANRRESGNCRSAATGRAGQRRRLFVPKGQKSRADRDFEYLKRLPNPSPSFERHRRPPLRLVSTRIGASKSRKAWQRRGANRRHSRRRRRHDTPCGRRGKRRRWCRGSLATICAVTCHMRPLATLRGPGRPASIAHMRVPSSVQAVCVHLGTGAV